MKPTVYIESLDAEEILRRPTLASLLRQLAVERPTPADAKLELERRPNGQLIAKTGSQETAVQVKRCFPWSDATRFLSLRDADDAEVALIGRTDDLDPSSRAALEVALLEAGFVMEIVRLESVEEEVEIRQWQVETRQGSRLFQTRLDDWPRELPGGGVLIRDLAGDLYVVPDPSALDKHSRSLLWAFVD